GAHALHGNERVAVIIADGHAVYDRALRWHTCKLFSGCRFNDGNGLPAFVGGDEETTVVRDGEVVNAVAGGNTPQERPALQVDLHDGIGSVARDVRAGDIGGG